MTRTLRLDRPLVAFDLETTGLNPQDDRIVEISCVKIQPSGAREIKTRRVNPQQPISSEAAAVHGISNADVANEPTFEQIARSLFDFLAGADLTGFNLEHFDLPMLQHEFRRAGLEFPAGPTRVLDSRLIFLQQEPRTLAAAYGFYCGKELVDAHSAEADAVAAADILFAQVERYPDMPTDVADLHEFCHPKHPEWIDARGKLRWFDGKAVIAFGKHRNRSLEALARDERGYLEWILNKDFGDDMKSVISAALEGVFPTLPPELASGISDPNG